ncbi:MAG: serine hydrolase [Erythrobacter sp.]|uniref:serine hydrolase domain-containing protein n=1 Tax=Erythrobacter sp. TaxID=1042 RepID=UPI003296D20A
MKRICVLTCLAAIAGACAPVASGSPEIASAPNEQRRDVAEFAQSMADLTVIDVDRFQFTASLDGCDTRDLPQKTVPANSKLNGALANAKSYSDQIDGVSLLILLNGEIIHESYNLGLDETSLTDSYSMQKSLLALTFAAALDDGVIGSLDETVAPYIPQWSADPRGQLTFRQLLHMASGQRASPFGGEESVALLWSDNINEVALQIPSAGPAGEQFWYLNSNSQIAGLALNNALISAGYGGYTEYFRERIWCAVGGGPAKLWLDREDGNPHYFSGMFAAARDWARLGEVIRNHGRNGQRQIISRENLKDILTPSPTNPNYAAHIWLGNEWLPQRTYSPPPGPGVIQSEPFLAEDVIFFDGFGGQRVYVVPSAGVTIVRTGMVSFAYDDAIIVNAVLSGLQAP